MIGLVLAAGAGRRLRPYTDTLPKALVPVDGDITILDIALRNLAEVGLDDVTIVVGYRAGAVEARQAELSRRSTAYAHPGTQRQGRGVEQRLLPLAGPGTLRPGRAAGQRRHRAPGERRADPAGGTRPRHPARRGQRQEAGRRGDEAIFDAAGQLTRITKLMDPADAFGEYIGATLIEASAAAGARRRAGGHLASATRTSTTRTATRSTPNRGGEVRAATIGEVAWVEVDNHDDLATRAGDRMPLLARTVHDAAAHRGPAGRRRRPRRDPRRRPDLGRRGRRGGGRAGPGRADRRADPAVAALRGHLHHRRRHPGRRQRAGRQAAARSYDAVVGIGGGKTIDTAKYAATRYGIPMVSVATSLANDGIASPVARLDHEGVKGSYGVHIPIAVVVDLDFVENGPDRHNRAGIGDVVSNISALADWELAREVRGEPVDGLAASLARVGAEAVLNHPGDMTDDGFVTVLAEALISSGLAMAVCGSVAPVQRRLPRDHARPRRALPGHRLARRAGRAGRAVLHLPAR